MKTTLLFVYALLISWMVTAQPPQKKSVVIGKMTTKENAILIVNPDKADQGVLLPQLSTGQRMSLKPNSPSEDGLIVFDTNLKSFFYWSDGAWVESLADNKRKTTFYSIDPLSFRHLNPNGSVRHSSHAIFETDNTFVTVTDEDEGETVMAPVVLPHRAKMRGLTVYYMDNDSRSITIKLMRKSLAGTNDEIISWQSTGSSSALQQVSLSALNGKEDIDLENYTYRLTVKFDLADSETVDEPAEATQRIYGVKIEYQE
jgi:hypothetical protein